MFVISSVVLTDTILFFRKPWLPRKKYRKKSKIKVKVGYFHLVCPPSEDLGGSNCS
jgi:hypothetical protein